MRREKGGRSRRQARKRLLTALCFGLRAAEALFKGPGDAQESITSSRNALVPVAALTVGSSSLYPCTAHLPPCSSSLSLQGTRGIIWEHELPNSSTWSYNQDRGFFHSFPSEVISSSHLVSLPRLLTLSRRLSQETNVAFVFADESEAGEMYKKVQGRGKYCSSTAPLLASSSSEEAELAPRPPQPPASQADFDHSLARSAKSAKAAAAPAASPSSSKKKKKGGPIDKSQISGPVRPASPSLFSSLLDRR